MQVLSHKVALITGASSGIGRAAALLFAREGARLVLVARRPHELYEVAAMCEAAGGRVFALPGDVADEQTAQAAVAAAHEHFGGLDIALNNAGGVGELCPITSMTTANWNEVVAVNLTSAFFAAKHQLPAMLARGGGSLIFTSTFVGHTAGMPGMAAYAASKAGLIGLTQVLASEHGPQGIRVNALLPGGTDTPMGRGFANTPETLAFVRNLHALKRMAQPDEIARAALFLASEAASFVTGTALLADGGVSINRV